jgi:hypothetical protein
MMAGDKLREFDIDLGSYIVGQLRPYLRELTARPAQGSGRFAVERDRLRHVEWALLDGPVWVGRVVAALPPALADHLWAGVAGEDVARGLTDAELASLSSAFDDPPERLESQCVWTPFPALHHRAIECVPEIRSELTRQTAEEWATDSAGFAARLCEEGLSLADGIATVCDWLQSTRRLLAAMGATPDGRSSASRTTAMEQATPPAVRQETRHERAQATGARVTESAVCTWQEAMQIAGLKKTKLYSLFHAGVLKGYRDGKMIRFYRKGLLDYMRERENVTLPPLRPARRPRAKSKSLAATRFRFL